MDLSPFPAVPMPERRPARRPHPHDEATAELGAFPGVGAPPLPSPAWPRPAVEWSRPRPEPVLAVRPRAALGVRAVDDFLGGGLPAGATVAVVGPPFGGKRALAAQFLATGLAAGQPALAAVTDGDVAQWRQAIASGVARVPDDRRGLLCILELFGHAGAGREALPGPDATLAAVAGACDALPSDRRRFVFDSFSTAAALSGFAPALSMLMCALSHLRREGATSLVLLEAGAHAPLEAQLVKRQCDGAIEFRPTAGLPEVQVTGLGLASPSPWLPCRPDPPAPPPFAPRPAEPLAISAAKA